MKIRDRKRQLYQFVLTVSRMGKRRTRYLSADLLAGIDHFELTAEDHAWLNMPPVGREFGSPDFERLSVIDAATVIAGSVERAEHWFINSTLPVFDNKTGEVLVSEGRTDELIKYIESLQGGFSG